MGQFARGSARWWHITISENSKIGFQNKALEGSPFINGHVREARALFSNRYAGSTRLHWLTDWLGSDTGFPFSKDGDSGRMVFAREAS
ncbi:MAG: hypothetical protein IVW54_20535 [Candidatus Binataceae bacterium]|nr:hypothetical protein [Candidatus Binataceae bacterium]